MRRKDKTENVLEVVEDTQNRVDILGYRMVERLVYQSGNPVARMLWENLKNPVADFLNQNFGPEPARIKPKRRPKVRSRRKPRTPSVRRVNYPKDEQPEVVTAEWVS